MAMPPPCNSSPLKCHREHDSVEDQSDPFVKLKSSGGGASLTDRELFDIWRAMRGGKTYSSKEEEDKKFSMFKEAILDKPSTHEDQSDPFAKLKSSGGVASLTDRELFDIWRAMRGGITYSSQEDEDKKFSMFKEAILDKSSTHEDQSDPFAKLKSPGGVASLTDRDIFDMWRAMLGGKTYSSQEDEDKAYDNFRKNICDAPANEDQYACNHHEYADLSKEETAEMFRTWGAWGKRHLYNAYIFRSNIEKWPRYAKTVYSVTN